MAEILTMTRKEVAATLCICPASVRNLEKRGLLTPIRITRKMVRYRCDEVAALLCQPPGQNESVVRVLAGVAKIGQVKQGIDYGHAPAVNTCFPEKPPASPEIERRSPDPLLTAISKSLNEIASRHGRKGIE